MRSEPCVEFLLFAPRCFPVASSHLGRISLRCVVITLPWVFYAEHNCTQTASEEFSFKGHCVTRFLGEVFFLSHNARFRFTFSGLKQSVPHLLSCVHFDRQEALPFWTQAHQLLVFLANMVPLFCLFPFVLWFSVPLRFLTLNLTLSFPESALCCVLATRPDIRDTPGHTQT